MKKAQEAEDAASARVAQIRKEVEKTLTLRWEVQKYWTKTRVFEHELAQMVDSAKSKDPVYKGHVSDNQWFIQKAIMYGTAANADMLAQLIGMMHRRG